MVRQRLSLDLINKRQRIPKGQSRETGNVGYTRQIKKITAQYVLDTTIRKQTKIT